jgi:hypothetical protein
MNPGHAPAGALVLPETVFTRSSLGNSAARAPQADLPRMVKTLLIAVDGRTSVAMFQKLLPNFGDVSALFEALEAGGYIERLGGVTVRAAGDPVPRPALRVVPAATAATAAEPPRPDIDTSRWFESTQRFTESTHRQSENAPASGWRGSPPPSSLQATDPARAPLFNAGLSGHRSTVTEVARVREARTLMSDFLFANLPDVAMEAVLALERLETTEQILRNIPEYQRLIAATGRKGAEHLSAVRNILSS